MSTQPVWTVMPAVVQAAGAGNFASILRIARTAAGLTLEEAGELAGYSASTLSRMETRPRRTWDVKELRRLAKVYGSPPAQRSCRWTAPQPQTAWPTRSRMFSSDG